MCPSALLPPPVALTPVRLMATDSRPNQSPRGRIGAPPPHLPVAHPGNQSAEQKEAPRSPPPVAPASTPLSASPLVSHTCSLCSQAKKALDRAVGVLLQTWTDRGDLSRAPDDAEQGLGWDVASLRQLVRTDEAVEAAWRVFCPSGEPQPNDAYATATAGMCGGGVRTRCRSRERTQMRNAESLSTSGADCESAVVG